MGKGCSACHGADGSGVIGPNIQNDTLERECTVPASRIMGITIDLTPQEVVDLVAWLNSQAP